jgi:hypothetical protein
MAHGERTASAAAEVPRDAALQCGICTPGFLIAAKALLEEPGPDRGGGPLLARRQPLPLHRLRQDRARRAGCRRRHAGGRTEGADERSNAHRFKAQVQVDRHAHDPSRRRRQGDRPRGASAPTPPPGMLVGRSCAARMPHAKIKSIDTSEGRKALPGVKAVITAKDIVDLPDRRRSCSASRTCAGCAATSWRAKRRSTRATGRGGRRDDGEPSPRQA